MSCPDLNAHRPAKILLHAFPSFEIGGSQLRFAALANHHGGRYRHLVVAMNGKAGCQARIEKDTPCEILDFPVPKNRTARNFFALRGLLKTVKPDLLITYNWGAIEWALANIVPLCRHLHIEDGFGPDESATAGFRRRAIFRRLVLSPHSRLVLPSKTLLDIARDDWHLPSQRLSYVPNGIDCARFAVSPDPEVLAMVRRTEDELVIGTVAALRPEKNLSRMIRAFARLPFERPARLVIVGDGVEREKLQILGDALSLGSRILFTGAMAQPERIIGAFDIFALSSDTEQMPFSILEAMAAGLPVAAVGVGDVAEMVSAENRAFIVPPSADRLAGAMATLLEDPARRAALGEGNRLHVRAHYDQDSMFRRYAALFDG